MAGLDVQCYRKRFIETFFTTSLPIIVESARDVLYGDINLQELILRANTSVVFKGRWAG
jgi:hypothetical protein